MNTHPIAWLCLLTGSFFSCLAATAQTQPLPFIADEDYTPELSTLQATWVGDYKGVDPHSANPQQTPTVISLTRTLILDPDMTYENTLMGSINDQEPILFGYEEGTYEYADGKVIYDVTYDRMLSIVEYILAGQTIYVENSPTSGNEKKHADDVIFTAEEEGTRQWIMTDGQLMSDRNPAMPAVYVMSRSAVDSAILPVKADKTCWSTAFDINGHPVNPDTHKGIIILGSQGKVIRR